MGFAPWRSTEDFAAFRDFIHTHHPDFVAMREGTIADACRMEAERRGEPFDRATPFEDLYQRYFEKG
jgi:hypothetical protein